MKKRDGFCTHRNRKGARMSNEFTRYVEENRLKSEIERVGVREAVPHMFGASDQDCVNIRKELGVYGHKSIISHKGT